MLQLVLLPARVRVQGNFHAVPTAREVCVGAFPLLLHLGTQRLSPDAVGIRPSWAPGAGFSQKLGGAFLAVWGLAKVMGRWVLRDCALST